MHDEWQRRTPRRSAGQWARRSSAAPRGDGPALLHRVELGIGHGEGEENRRGIRIPAWSPAAPIRVALPAAFADALAASGTCEFKARAAEGEGAVRAPVETGHRRLRFRLGRVSLAKADYQGNDDGANAAPELFVTVRRLGDEDAILSSEDRFTHDSFEVAWDRGPEFEAAVTRSDRFRVRLWDKDLMDHDLLLEWNFGWEHLSAAGRAFELTSKNGTAVVFEIEKLK